MSAACGSGLAVTKVGPVTYSPQDLVPTWVGLVDDAAIFPPGNAPLHDAAAAHVARRSEWWADLVGPLVVKDTDVPLLRGTPARLSVVVTGGAGQLAGPAGLCARLGLELAGARGRPARPRRPAGQRPPRRRRGRRRPRRGSRRRRARCTSSCRPATRRRAGWPPPTRSPAAGLRLKFRTGGLEAHLFPTAEVLAAWIDAALDRETAFKCTAGLHRALRHRDPETGFEHHGFLNVLTATAAGLRGRRTRGGGGDPRRDRGRRRDHPRDQHRPALPDDGGSRRSAPAR